MWNDGRTINLIANTLVVLAVLLMLVTGVLWVGQRPLFALAAHNAPWGNRAAH